MQAEQEPLGYTHKWWLMQSITMLGKIEKRSSLRPLLGHSLSPAWYYPLHLSWYTFPLWWPSKIMSDKENVKQKEEDKLKWGERDEDLVVYEKRELKRKKRSSVTESSSSWSANWHPLIMLCYCPLTIHIIQVQLHVKVIKKCSAIYIGGIPFDAMTLDLSNIYSIIV